MSEENVNIEDVDLDEVDLEAEEVEEPKAKPARKARAKKTAEPKAEGKPIQPKIEFGSKELAEHVNAEAGTNLDAYKLRILLRKLTKDGVIQRDESQARARYSFTGPEDPQVVAIVEAVKSGAHEKAEKERLAGLKEKREAKKPAEGKKAPARKSRAKKQAEEPVAEAEVEDDFDIEEI